MVIWSSEARGQLLDLDTYLSERSEDAASQMIFRVYSAIGTLEDFPEVGRPGRVAGTRELVVSGTPYLVMYRIVKSQIHILAVLHGAQKWPESTRP
jgi:toxin ParE1/3/4